MSSDYNNVVSASLKRRVGVAGSMCYARNRPEVLAGFLRGSVVWRCGRTLGGRGGGRKSPADELRTASTSRTRATEVEGNSVHGFCGSNGYNDTRGKP